MKATRHPKTQISLYQPRVWQVTKHLPNVFEIAAVYVVDKAIERAKEQKQ